MEPLGIVAGVSQPRRTASANCASCTSSARPARGGTSSATTRSRSVTSTVSPEAAKLVDLREIDGAFRDGWLTWEQVLVLTRVAVPKHEAAWLARALESSLEDLAYLVARSAEGWAPPASDRALAEPGAAALETTIERLVAGSWRARARGARRQSSVGHQRAQAAPPSRERLRAGRVTGLPRHGGAPNARRGPNAPPSTS